MLDATACPAGQYRAEYFPNRTLTGTAATVVCEGAPLNRWWGNGAPPGMGVAADNFSVRWTGKFVFPAGRRTFTATHNNGIRVYLDGGRIIDRWNITGTARTPRLGDGGHAHRPSGVLGGHRAGQRRGELVTAGPAT